MATDKKAPVRKTMEELEEEKRNYVPPAPKTVEEIMEIFKDIQPTPNSVFLAIELPPERTDKGIILNMEQREEKAINDILHNGALIIAAGDAVRDWDENIKPGNKALVSANIQPTYQLIREGVIVRVTERHFIVATRDASAKDFVIAEDEE